LALVGGELLPDARRRPAVVIRYDHRDTGGSVTYPRGRPGYTGADLTVDAADVLDAYGIAAAHLVGVSAGGDSRRSSRSTARTASSRSSNQHLSGDAR
jgi:pimeloyl-ACP methyl ester carboxylesterase